MATRSFLSKEVVNCWVDEVWYVMVVLLEKLDQIWYSFFTINFCAYALRRAWMLLGGVRKPGAGNFPGLCLEMNQRVWLTYHQSDTPPNALCASGTKVGSSVASQFSISGEKASRWTTLLRFSSQFHSWLQTESWKGHSTNLMIYLFYILAKNLSGFRSLAVVWRGLVCGWKFWLGAGKFDSTAVETSERISCPSNEFFFYIWTKPSP